MSVRRLAAKDVQPASFAFSEANSAWAAKQIAQYPEGRQASAVIAIMWRAQEQEGGWLSEAAIRVVADMLDMPYIRALEVATFYTMFQLQPVGRKAHVQVCGTTPCMLRGAGELIDICKHRIHHDPFHLSDDGDFSWEEVECLGACVNAPMAMVWKDTYEDLNKDSFNKMLDGFASGQPPKPGPQDGRQFAAPAGGPRVLKEGGAKPAANSNESGGAPLQDTEAKKPTESASERESPAPTAPADDATKTAPPSGDPAPKASGDEAGAADKKADAPKGSKGPAKKPKKK